ncbi:MAG: TetR/AcrR family transcriptional regulator [Verrucomicrobiota bacterium]
MEKSSTRQRLLAASVEILRTHGAGHVTTQRLADEVGIVQSGVYRHFRGGEECLVAAAREAVERIRQIVERDRLLRGLAANSNPDSLADHLDLVLREAQRHWPTFDLVRRFRQEDSKLGQALSDGFDCLLRDVIAHFHELEKQQGLASPRKRSRERLARVVIDMILCVAEEVKDVKSPGARRKAASELALLIEGAAVQFYRGAPASSAGSGPPSDRARPSG